MMTLYIEGVKMDTPPDFFFTMTYRSSWFTSIDKITLSYSGTITLPKTANNTAALGAIISPSSVSDIPYKYINADIMQDGIVFMRGAQVYLQQVTDDGYKLSLVWGDMNILKRLKDDEKELTALSTITPDFNWTVADTKSFPNINDGRFISWLWEYSGTGLSAKHPSVYAKDIITAICANYGILPPPSEDYERIKAWVNPLLNRIDPLITDGEKYTQNDEWQTSFSIGEMLSSIEQYDFEVLMSKGHADDTPPRDYNIPAGALSSTDGIFQITRKLRAIGSASSSNSTLHSIVPLYSNIKILSRGRALIKCKGIADTTQNIQLKLIYKHRAVGAAAYEEEELMSIVPVYKEGDSVVGSNFLFEWNEESDLITYVSDKQTDIYKKLDARIVWRLVGANLTTEVVESNVTISSRLEYIVNGAPYFNFANYPKIKMFDYIKNIAIMAGKFIYIENVEHWTGSKKEEKPQLRMVSYDDALTNTDAYDWSAYTDRELRDMTFTAGDWCQRNIFSYKEDDDYTDSITMPIASEVLKDKYEVNVPFNAARADSNGNLVVKKYAYEADEYGDAYFESGGLEFMKGYNVYKGNDDKMYIGRVAVDAVTNTASVKALPWSELKANYDNLIATLQQMKVITETMRLPLMVMRDLNLHRLVYLDKYGCHFAILQIRTRSNGTCDVELLKI